MIEFTHKPPDGYSYEFKNTNAVLLLYGCAIIANTFITVNLFLQSGDSTTKKVSNSTLPLMQSAWVTTP